MFNLYAIKRSKIYIVPSNMRCGDPFNKNILIPFDGITDVCVEHTLKIYTCNNCDREKSAHSEFNFQQNNAITWSIMLCDDCIKEYMSTPKYYVMAFTQLRESLLGDLMYPIFSHIIRYM